MDAKRPVYSALPSDDTAYGIILELSNYGAIRATIHTLAEGEACETNYHIPLFTSSGHYRGKFFCCSPNTFARRGIIVPDFAKKAAHQVAVNPAMIHKFGTIPFKEALCEMNRYFVRRFIKQYAPKIPRRQMLSPYSECVN